MPVDEIIRQFHASSRLMKKAIATDDSGAIARLDGALSADLERIMDFRVRNEAERLEVGRFLAGYLENMGSGSSLATRAAARMVELIDAAQSPGGARIADTA